jgi:F-type H+-transporting ATPase subunit delta
MAEAVTIVRPYAVAAFRLAKEKKALAKWSEMLSFASAIAADAQMQAFIADPKV